MESPLDNIHNPNDLRPLTQGELTALAEDIRRILIEVSYKNGGHLASNLGVVELTMAVHRIFDSPRDKILFDVSHQSYVHKLLTGRNDERFFNIRQTGGYSGFYNPNESEHDMLCVGHAGTALSTALGLCKARNHLNQRHKIVVILGDGALACGPTMEALNSIAADVRQLLVILNDNDYSIDRNIGAMATYLNKIILSQLYKRTMRGIGKVLTRNKVGLKLWRICRKLKLALKDLLLPSSLFEHYGMRYIGPVDGHNLAQLEEYLRLCRNADSPILLHVKTTKGKGNPQATANPKSFHRVGPTVAKQGTSMKDALGQTVVELARANKKIIGITAAMASGTGLSHLGDTLPEQCVDVGIAEEHAVTMCAGLAKGGMVPICAIYSTFMQRAFDQIAHDICLQNLHAIFCLDRAGLAANDGPTHHGLFDISYLRCLPNAVIMQPKNSGELCAMLRAALGYTAPVFIRYNSTYTYDTQVLGSEVAFGRSEIIKHGEGTCLIALGHFIDIAHQVDGKLGGRCGIVNARFIKPLDEQMLRDIAVKYGTIATLEDNVLAGGFGSSVAEFYCDNSISVKLVRIGWPDNFIEHGSSEEILRETYSLDPAAIAAKILNYSNFSEAKKPKNS
ncbi:MAG: 1-deoxy-D-xylulose-5-phosphate synthase [Puniceicoccales bacterium]|jgi:1-deoxy-D-xylulose-5-phosphate synthase|nr:1-deoxy-D-xylulose-5-phosphate synthase [Puniceicoccales bacterium]